MPQCQHCGVDMASGSIARHERLCPDNPPVRAAIRAAMTDPDHPGVQLSTPRYDARRALFGVPHSNVLEIRYGSWTQAGAEFGLLPSVDFRGAHLLTPARCPHCGKTFANSVLHRHTATCPEKPELRAAILSVMRDADFPQFAVTQSEYRDTFSATPIPSLNSLRKHFGSWHRAVAYYGLSIAPDSELQEARAMAEVQATADEERRLLREDEAQSHTFTAYRVHDAPGLYINGRPCVRLELR